VRRPLLPTEPRTHRERVDQAHHDEQLPPRVNIHPLSLTKNTVRSPQRDPSSGGASIPRRGSREQDPRRSVRGCPSSPSEFP
jgi:hypothetical protein